MKSTVKLQARPRNTLVLNPLMKKGGKHVKSYKSTRSTTKCDIRKGNFE